jgi:hypothetical protein
MRRSLLKNQLLTFPISTKISELDYEQLITVARALGVTQTALVRAGIQQYLAQYKNLLQAENSSKK